MKRILCVDDTKDSKPNFLDIKANKALYQAKDSGRNRVCMSS